MYPDKPGIYDNCAVQQRQRWERDKEAGLIITGFIDRILLEQQRNQGYPVEPWGKYPDTKNINNKQVGRPRGEGLITGRFDTREKLIENINFMYWNGSRIIDDCARNSEVSTTTAAKLIMSKDEWEKAI